jgi:hypothetical protein
VSDAFGQVCGSICRAQNLDCKLWYMPPSRLSGPGLLADNKLRHLQWKALSIDLSTLVKYLCDFSSEISHFFHLMYPPPQAVTRRLSAFLVNISQDRRLTTLIRGNDYGFAPHIIFPGDVCAIICGTSCSAVHPQASANK